MHNPQQFTTSHDVEKGVFNSEAKKDVQNSSSASEFYNPELRIFQIEGKIQDLEIQMERIINNMLPSWIVYMQMRDDKKLLELKLRKEQSQQIDSLIPPRGEQDEEI